MPEADFLQPAGPVLAVSRRNLRRLPSAKLTKFLLLLMAVILAWFYREPVLALIAIARDRDALVSTLAAYGAAGPVFVFLILSLQVLLAAIPGHFVMLVSGYLYGFGVAALITHTSTVLASQLAYWLARRYGRPVVSRFASSDLVDKWIHKVERQGMVFFFFSFVLPIFPSDVMNFVAGLSGLSSRKFFIANFVGRLPTSLLFSLIGAQGFRITATLVVVAAMYTVLMFIAWWKVTPLLEARHAGSVEQQ